MQIRHGLAVWLGPVLLLTGLAAVVVAGLGELGARWVAAGAALLVAGIVRAAWQTKRLPGDTDVTRLPMQHETGGGAGD